jgi:hypothetical protein
MVTQVTLKYGDDVFSPYMCISCTISGPGSPSCRYSNWLVFILVNIEQRLARLSCLADAAKRRAY